MVNGDWRPTAVVKGSMENGAVHRALTRIGGVKASTWKLARRLAMYKLHCHVGPIFRLARLGYLHGFNSVSELQFAFRLNRN